MVGEWATTISYAPMVAAVVAAITFRASPSLVKAPFEALYGRPCTSPSHWLDRKDPVIVGPEMIEETVKIVDLIRKRMKEAQDCEKS